MDVGNQIRERRQRLGLSQEELAQRLYVSRVMNLNLNLNLNLPRFRLHPYAAFRAAPSRCLASNSAGLRFPSAEWILTLL